MITVMTTSAVNVIMHNSTITATLTIILTISSAGMVSQNGTMIVILMMSAVRVVMHNSTMTATMTMMQTI